MRVSKVIFGQLNGDCQKMIVGALQDSDTTNKVIRSHNLCGREKDLGQNPVPLAPCGLGKSLLNPESFIIESNLVHLP